MEYAKQSALNHARERFCVGLVKRAQELRPLVAAFGSDPVARVPRAALQRRLHTLLASAQLFDEVTLVELLQTVVNRLDAVGLSGDLWRESDRQALFSLLAYLGGRGPGEGREDTEPGLNLHESGPRARAVVPGFDGFDDSSDSEASFASIDAGDPVSRVETRATPAMPISTLPPMSEPLSRERSQQDAFAPAWSITTSARTAQPTTTPASSVLLVRVLLVCSRPHAVQLRALLEDAPVELLHAADPEQALDLLKRAMPACALVAAEFATLPDIDLVGSLRMDATARLDGVYLLLPPGVNGDAEFVRQSGADGVLSEPLTLDALAPMLERASRSRGRGGLRTLSERAVGTVDEIASYVAEEVRLGIAEGLRDGLGEQIALNNTEELTAAAQSVIGRVRAHLSAQSHGRVSFPGAETAHAARAATEAAARMPLEAAAHAKQVNIDMRGTRVLVADDDPAVLRIFAGILRDAGAEVSQARDGRVALDLVRRKRPQVILSDILMPKIDGIQLCRELRRDVLSERLPVVLLSWKDDLLERMRELDAGASAYLRKDARAEQVLQTLGNALAPRLQLMAALRAAGEVAGRVEDVGIVALIESVSEARPDARISVEDAWSLFEIELRDGQRIAVTRTSADGSFSRSERALVQLLGVTAGGFSVMQHQGALRGALPEPLHHALQAASDTVSSVLEAVSDARLMHVARLTFDEEVLSYLLSCTPTRLHEVVASFRHAQQPSPSAHQLLSEGVFSPGELEGHLRELARRGAITGVWDTQGDDMVAAALHARAPQPHVLLPEPAFSTEPDQEPASEPDITLVPAATETAAFVPVRSNAVPVQAIWVAPDIDLSAIAATTTLQGLGAVTLQLPQSQRGAPLPAARASVVEYQERQTSPEVIDLRQALEVDGGQYPDHEPDSLSFELQQHGASFDSVITFRPMEIEREIPLDLRTIRVPKPTISIGQRARGTGSRLTFTLAALAALGYFSAAQFEHQSWMRSDFTRLWTRWGELALQPLAAALGRETSINAGVDPRLVALGVVLPYIDTSLGVNVHGDQGLLVIQHAGQELPDEIFLDGRPLGKPPLAIPVSASPHQLTFKHDPVITQHTVMMYAGKTRAITLPLPAL